MRAVRSNLHRDGGDETALLAEVRAIREVIERIEARLFANAALQIMTEPLSTEARDD